MRLTDAQRLSVECGRSQCISAGAGTGKTTTLTERYLKYLEFTEPRFILALTYTDKAATEMLDRVRRVLLARDPDHQEERMEQLSRATVTTFHSFCTRLIREFPVEMGLDPDFQIINEDDEDLLMDDAYDEILNNGALKDRFHRIMYRMDPGQVRDSIKYLYRRRHYATKFFSIVEEKGVHATIEHFRLERRDAAARMLLADASACRAVENLIALSELYSDGNDAGAKYLREVAPLLRRFLAARDPGDRSECFIEIYAKRVKKNVGSQKTFSSDDLTLLQASLETLNDVCKSLGADIFVKPLPAHMEEGLADLILSFNSIFNEFRLVVDKKKMAVGVIDFTDMLIAVHRLFTNDPEFVRRNISTRYRYVMVDETQDTDLLQLEIIKAILGPDGRDRLFVVGDPKQSIYLFRDVDVSMFKETREYVVDKLDGEYRPLDVNHRSAPEIVNFTNALFGRLMSQDDRPWKFTYERVNIADYRSSDQGSLRLLLMTCNPDTIDRLNIEGYVVARTILESVRAGIKVYWEGGKHLDAPRHCRFSDFAILLKTRNNLPYYERALKDLGIPYRIHKGMGFFSRPEVLDMVLLLRFLRDRSDDVALMGVLRSPYIHLSDPEIFLLNQGRGIWFSRLGEAGETSQRHKAAHEKLERWLGYSRRESLVNLMDRLIRESDICSIYGGMEKGDEMLGNLEKLVGMVRGLNAGGFAGIDEVVNTIDRRIVTETREESVQVEEESADAVKIMTVHTAKGLEFPIVILPEMDVEKFSNRTEGIFVDDRLGLGTRTIDPVSMGNQPDDAMSWFVNIRGEKDNEEFKRLFYVASTRAKDHLIMTAVPWFPPIDKPGDAKTWFHLMTESLGLGRDDMSLQRGDFTDPCGYKGSIAISFVKMDVGNPWVEKEPYSVKEWMRGLPIRKLRHADPPSRTRALSPSKLRRTREDGALDDEEADDADYNSRDTMDPREYGTIVHEVFQGRPVKIVLREHGICDDALGLKITTMYERFMTSEIMRDLTDDLKEIPFELKNDEGTVKGRIDRLVRKAGGGWILIDYKTGSPDTERMKEKREEYRGQMEAYLHAAERLLKERPRAILYFTDNGTWIEI